MGQDLLKKERRLLRPGWAWEFKGKGDKTLNRRMCRKRLKARDQREEN